jgi:hypothetical protein
MDKSSTTHQNESVWQRHGSTRVSLIVMLLASVMAVLTIYGAFAEQTVHACNDKEKNPPDVQKLCKRLTKHQWWGAYYTGKQP